MTPIVGQVYKLNLELNGQIASCHPSLNNISGDYELIKKGGGRLHLFSNDRGIDIFITKAEFENAIKIDSKPTQIQRKHR